MALPARRIGIREARSRLGMLLKTVKYGTEWVITDRGRPVARLTSLPPEDLSFEDRLKGLEAAGRIGPLPDTTAPLPPPLPISDGIAQHLLQEDRGH